MRSTTAWAVAAALLAAPAALAQAPQPGQTSPGTTAPTPTPQPGMNPPITPPAPGAAMPGTAPQRQEGPRTTTTPAAGANSFTEGQARRRIQDAGFTDVQNLRKDAQGVWRGQAMRNGARADVGLDFRGNVVIGNTPAAR